MGFLATAGCYAESRLVEQCQFRPCAQRWPNALKFDAEPSREVLN